MKTHQTLLLGLAGLGFVLSAPSQAASTALFESPVLIVEGFVVADRAQVEPRQQQRRELREEERFRGNRNYPLRDVDRSSHRREYGYGYERRQQPHPRRNDSDHRD